MQKSLILILVLISHLLAAIVPASAGFLYENKQQDVAKFCDVAALEIAEQQTGVEEKQEQNSLICSELLSNSSGEDTEDFLLFALEFCCQDSSTFYQATDFQQQSLAVIEAHSRSPPYL